MVGDGIRVRATVDLSGEGADVGRIGLWDGFWIRAFPKSCSWSWCGLLMAVVVGRQTVPDQCVLVWRGSTAELLSSRSKIWPLISGFA